MIERDVQIVNRNGLHARPAAEIVKAAAKFKSEITHRARRPRGERQEHHGRDDARRRVRRDAHRCAPTARTREQARRCASPTLIANKFGEQLVERILIGHSRVAGHRGRARAPPALGGARRPAPHHPRRADRRRRSRAFTTRGRARERRLRAVRDARRADAGPEEARDLRRADLDPRGPRAHRARSRQLIRQNLGAEKAFDLVMLEWRQQFARSTRADDARARRRPDRRPHPRAVAPARLARSRSGRCAEGRERDPRHARPDAEPHGAARSRGDRRHRDRRGTRTSHVAILARSLGLPAVVGLRDATDAARRRRARRSSTARAGVLVDQPEPTPRSTRTSDARSARHELDDAGAARSSRARRRSRTDGVRLHAARQRRSARGGGVRGRAAAPRASG